MELDVEDAEVPVVHSVMDSEPINVVLDRDKDGTSLRQQPSHPPISPVSTESQHSKDDIEKNYFLFSFMADFPWPFLVVVPLVLAFLIAFGWSMDDKVEVKVENLWIATKGSYARDKDYAATYGMKETPVSTYLTMAKSRDGGNLMTADRLEEIRTRMEEAESTTVCFFGALF